MFEYCKIDNQVIKIVTPNIINEYTYIYKQFIFTIIRCIANIEEWFMVAELWNLIYMIIVCSE